MQFMITAYDAKDEDALARRMRVRPDHLENMKKVMAKDRVICAGGLTEDGKMVGSFLIMEFPDREALDAYLRTEPYIVGKVWETVKVETCNAVIVDNKM